MEKVARGYKYRLYPTKGQEATLDTWQAACWEVQRACILQRRIAFQKHSGRKPNWATQGQEVTEARRELAHLAVVPARILRFIAKRVDLAYAAMFRAIKEGARGEDIPVPRWPRRHSEVGLVLGGADRGTHQVDANARFTWWMLGDAQRPLGLVKVRSHRPLPEGTEVKQVHITRRADGWYISFSCLVPAPALPTALPAKDISGVDLGCIHHGDKQRVAAVDDGRIYSTTDNLKRSAKRKKTLQRLVDPKRKAKGKAKTADPKSNRSKKRRKQIAKLEQRIARQREHEQQYIARRLVDTAETVAFEDINWKALRKAGGAHKKGLNRSMSTAAPGRLIWLTQDKAMLAGRAVVKVPAAYTSQDCSACGERGKQKGLSVRSWVCTECGAVHDRDVNAAQNIAKRARK